MSSRVRRFEVGKYYQFTGEPMTMKDGELLTSKVGAVYESLIMSDTEIVHNWMDRRIRKCVYASEFDGTAAVFEDIYFHLKNELVPWTVIRSYECYLEAGMFQEVEVA